jgi:hypothetical protein
VELTFTNRDLARLCNKEAELVAFAGADAEALEQLLFEIEAARLLGHVEDLTYVRVLRAPAGRIAAHGADDAGVLLEPATKPYRTAKAATIVAVAVGDQQCNPEGAAWPRASAMSRITR